MIGHLKHLSQRQGIKERIYHVCPFSTIYLLLLYSITAVAFRIKALNVFFVVNILLACLRNSEQNERNLRWHFKYIDWKCKNVFKNNTLIQKWKSFNQAYICSQLLYVFL